jgi:hypothetical protein
VIYQLNKYQAATLHRMANYESQQLITVVSPISEDSEATIKSLTEQKNDVLDLHGLGLLRDDDEELLQIASAVSLKLERPVRVFTITPIGRSMFHDTGKRPLN